MLERTLDYGITEERFWEMTIAEIQRAVESAIRVKQIEAKERASFDYILAGLVVRGVSNVLGGKGNYPSLEEAYPGVFDDVVEEKQALIEEQKMNLSALRFKLFAQSFNDNLRRKEGVKEDK